MILLIIFYRYIFLKYHVLGAQILKIKYQLSKKCLCYNIKGLFLYSKKCRAVRNFRYFFYVSKIFVEASLVPIDILSITDNFRQVPCFNNFFALQKYYINTCYLFKTQYFYFDI